MIEKEIINLIHKIIREDLKVEISSLCNYVRVDLILDDEIIHTSIEKLDLDEK